MCAIISPIALYIYMYIAAGTWLGGGPAGVVNRPPLAFRVVCKAVSVVSASHVCIVGEEHAVGENNCWGRFIFSIRITLTANGKWLKYTSAVRVGVCGVCVCLDPRLFRNLAWQFEDPRAV